MLDAKDYLTNQEWNVTRLGLSRIKELLELMGNPHEKLKYIHVAGTNGKGSTCAMLVSILEACGYQTGLFTTPHISRFNEQIQINGDEITDEELSLHTQKVKAFANIMPDHPTEFEMTTAIAIEYFLSSGCDIVVMETGMGGRLDATNIIPLPEIAVITPISLDHTKELGETIEKIAFEKAGIIKNGGRVVCAPQEKEVAKLLLSVCKERQTQITFVNDEEIMVHKNDLDGQLFDFNGYDSIYLPLLGDYQRTNAATAVSAVIWLRDCGWRIEDKAIYEGLANVKWPARFQVLKHEPVFILDGGHNPHCVDSLVRNLEYYFPKEKIVFIMGVLADKDYKTMIRKIIPHAKRVFTVTANNKRALDSESLAKYFRRLGLEAVACDNIAEGVKNAMDAAGEGGVVCAFGSLYIAAQINVFFL
ncbi:MAG: bifunctional folylpolyglutamate synthase/dihydrofolate synthase [Lachnospiraceae bacterium]|jgi:dihydrofolate synthase/folylpolyglutamate synthase|nr:bifunctional folylpolyglutamate synthase/dihydrofolate synthase [Lachnospiraceae bacterium]